MNSTFPKMIGQTMVSVTGGRGHDEMIFTSVGGDIHRFYHEGHCCETVIIEDIVGDLDDLIGSPILVAEEVSSEGYPAPKNENVVSDTWTFYVFRTLKGTVTVRWLGDSNGHYSEAVDYSYVPSPVKV